MDESNFDDAHDKQLKAAYYQEILRSWSESRMYTDRQIVYLSAAGIGLLAHLKHSGMGWSELIAWTASLSMFFFAIVVVVFFVMRFNSEYLEPVIFSMSSQTPLSKSEEVQLKSYSLRLKLCSRISNSLFVLAALLLAFVMVQSL